MAKPKHASGAGEVDAFVAACKHARRPELEALRAIVRAAAPRLVEGVKWNAPSYHFASGDHCLTFNLGAKDRLRLVFHCGSKQKDTRGNGPLVEVDHAWLAWPADDRAVATFFDMAEVVAASAALTKLVRAWVLAVGEVAGGK